MMSQLSHFLLAAFMWVNWLGNHSANELGPALPPTAAGIWGLAVVVVPLATLHVWGRRAESRMTSEERAKQEDKLQELPFSMPRTRFEIVAYFITMVGMTTFIFSRTGRALAFHISKMLS